MRDTEFTKAKARRIREHALRMVHKANASHIGTGLSMADILAVLYSGIARVDRGSLSESVSDPSTA